MLTTDFSLNVEAEAVLLAQGADPVRIRERRPALYTMAEEAARLGADLFLGHLLLSSGSGSKKCAMIACCWTTAMH